MTELCLTPSFLVLWHPEVHTWLPEPGVPRREQRVGVTLGAQVCLQPVDCQPPRMPASQNASLSTGQDAAQGSFPDRTYFWEHALSWNGDATRRRASGLINGNEASVRMYSNLTQLNKLSFWGRKRLPPPPMGSKNADKKNLESFCLLHPGDSPESTPILPLLILAQWSDLR